MEHVVDAIRIRVVGPTLLQDIPQLRLGSTVEDAINLYGPYTKKTKDQNDLPENELFTFNISNYHTIDVWVWKSEVHAIVYYSTGGDPEMDLETILTFYGETQGWLTINEGYNYRREDGKIRLWCSAMPAIGVGTEEYMQNQATYKGADPADG